MIGFLTLLEKEFLRFWKVAFQTVAAPVLTALLYLLIFGHVLDDHVQVHGVGYTSFLIPGLVMMQVLQNAFANSSSSLIQAKITGSIVFVLLPPIPYGAFFAAYVLAAVLRGLMVGLGVLLATVWFVDLKVVSPVWILVFSLLGGGLFGALGMIDGFRYGFFGVSDVAPEQSLMVVVACFAVVSWGTLNLLKRGWKLRA